MYFLSITHFILCLVFIEEVTSWKDEKPHQFGKVNGKKKLQILDWVAKIHKEDECCKHPDNMETHWASDSELLKLFHISLLFEISSRKYIYLLRIIEAQRSQRANHHHCNQPSCSSPWCLCRPASSSHILFGSHTPPVKQMLSWRCCKDLLPQSTGYRKMTVEEGWEVVHSWAFWEIWFKIFWILTI